jgi:amino acid adenylation domain-containing protein
METIEGFRLSPQQARLWLLMQGDHKPTYFAQCVVSIEGTLDARLLQIALERVVQRHEILRTNFRCLPSMTLPLQIISQSGQAIVKGYDLNGRSAQAQRSWFETFLEEASQVKFDFERGPLLQTALAQQAPDRHLLLLRLPAMCADAAGLRNLVRELGLRYTSLLGKEDLPGEPLQYVDLAEWQNELLESAELETGREYWRKQVPAESFALKLTFEIQHDEKAELRSSNGFLLKFLPVVLEPDLVSQIEALADKHKTSIEVFLLTCLHILLWRLTGQSEIVVGTSYDGRNYEELKDALGLFEHYLPIGCRLEGTTTFLEVLAKLDKLAREAHAWQECFTWEQIDGYKAEVKSIPFFSLCYEYWEQPASYRAGTVSFTITDLYTCIDRFKLKLSALRRSDGLSLTIHYDAQLFRREEIGRLAEQYLSLLRSAIHAPEAVLKELEILSQGERGRILREFNRVGRQAEREAEPIHQLIEAQAVRQPEAVAVVVEEQELSYGELNRRANQLGHYLQGLGVGPEEVVGLCLERSVELVVGMVGILKAGGAYLPLDPVLPVGRLRGMLADGGVRVVVSERRLGEELGLLGGEWGRGRGEEGERGGLEEPEISPPLSRSPSVVYLDADCERISQESEENPVSRVGVENLVYVLFTSGSTGRPKGVGVEHRQLYNYVEGVRERLGLPEGASYATVTTFGADLGHTAIFPALCRGGTLHVVRQERASDGAGLADYCRRHEVDCLKIVPSHLSALLGSGQGAGVLPRRRLVLGGEASSWELIGRVVELQPECRILNHYGPTETTVGVMTCEVESGEAVESQSRTVPLGRPLGGVEVYILDERMEVVPVWVAGEVYIGGAQVGRGYLGAADQTAERFVPDPFSEAGGRRLYRTGDVGRYLSDGRVEFLGRVDEQVKIRGYRVELGEIEAVIEEQGGVRESVVVVRESGEGEKRLVAYVVEKEGAELEAREVRRYLGERLPDYMVPGAVVKLERLPLTANGKVDRGALPEPESDAGGEYVGPRTHIEELVAGIWAEVLGVERVGVNDNFFELGGHSLLVARVASRVSEAFGLEMPFQIFFEKRTVADLAESIQAAQLSEQGMQLPSMLPFPRDGELPLSFAQQRLWFFDQLDPNSSSYNISGAVRLTGQLNVRALEQTLNEIIRRHEVLRTGFPTANRLPVQVIAEAKPMSLPMLDLSALPPQQREAEARRLSAEEAVRPFRLDQGPLLRVGLLRLQEDDHILFFTMHHIVSDAWSIGVLVREVAALYEAFSAGNPSPLHELRIQYADFAHWQREWLQGEVLEGHVSYWKQRLDGLPPALQLPTDRPRPAVQTFRGERYFFELSQPQTEALKALSRREGVTLFMTLLGAFKVLMHYYTAQDDMVVGTNVANRNHLETENMIGFFINQLVLRTNMFGNPSFRELLSRVREVALGAYAHQDLPFEKLVGELQPQRDMSRSLLFQVKFELQEGITRVLELPGLAITPLESNHKVVRHDLHLSMWEREQILIGALQYNVDLFNASSIARIAGEFKALIGMVAEQPDARLSKLEGRLIEMSKQEQLIKEKELEETSLKKLKTLRRRTLN